MAASVYIGPQSARILKDNDLGYVDLSGNCYLAFEHVLIEKEGKRNVRPSTRPLRSLFAPRATRVVRVLLAEPSRAWRLEELAKAAAVSLGHSHNVVKRLEDLRWVERDEASASTWASRPTSSRGGRSPTPTAPTRSRRTSPPSGSPAGSWPTWRARRPPTGAATRSR